MEKACEVCGKLFAANYREQRACSTLCGNRNRFSKTLLERFNNYAPVGSPNECRMWTGSVLGGYGSFSFQGKRMTAHHVALYLATGRWPAQGEVVMHSCDIPLCVNHLHLRFGTHRENVDDCISKRRHSHGRQHGMSVLSEDDVISMRADFDSGKFTQAELAAKHGVSRSTAWKVVRRFYWKHI